MEGAGKREDEDANGDDAAMMGVKDSVGCPKIGGASCFGAGVTGEVPGVPGRPEQPPILTSIWLELAALDK